MTNCLRGDRETQLEEREFVVGEARKQNDGHAVKGPWKNFSDCDKTEETLRSININNECT